MVVAYDPRAILPRGYNGFITSMWEAIGEDWVQNSPTLQNVTLGAGGSNRMWRKGKGGIGQLHGEIILGTSPTMGPATLLPFTDGANTRWQPADHSPRTSSVAVATPGLDVVYFDASSGNYVPGAATLGSFSLIFAALSGAVLSSTVPFTWAAGDKIIWRASYLRFSGSELFE